VFKNHYKQQQTLPPKFKTLLN